MLAPWAGLCHRWHGAPPWAGWGRVPLAGRSSCGLRPSLTGRLLARRPPTLSNILLGWRRAGEVGKSVGLEWGGDWKGFKDPLHFQCTGGLTLAECRELHAGGLAAVREKVH